MKKTIFTLLAFFVFVNAFATIRRVNNNIGITPVAGLVYINTSTTSSSNAFMQAYNDAQNGDTLYLEPSTVEYRTGDGLEKRLVIIGNGYRITENAGLISPLPFNLGTSKLRGSTTGGGIDINLKPGSENSVLIGLEFLGQLNVTANNVLIERSLFGSGIHVFLHANNIIFKQNHIFSYGLQGNGQNNTVSNCILTGIGSHTNWVFDQCYMTDITNVTLSVFTNCIVNGNVNNNSNSFSHCMKIGGAFPTAGMNNNLENVALADVFIIANPAGGSFINFDKNFRLSPTSPSIGTGISGFDMGPFGGLYPYRLSGQPPIPVVTNFFLSTTGSSASGLTGSITIKSNN